MLKMKTNSISTPASMDSADAYPYLTVADQALEMMRKFLVEFGLTPSARSRIKLPEGNGAADEFDLFLEAS